MKSKVWTGVLLALFGGLILLQIWQWSKHGLNVFAPLLLLCVVGLMAGLVPAFQKIQNRMMFVCSYGAAFLFMWGTGHESTPIPVGRAWILSTLAYIAIISILAFMYQSRTGRAWVWFFAASIAFGLLIAYISGPKGGPDWMLVWIQKQFGIEDWREAQKIVFGIRKTMHFFGYGLAAYCTAVAVFKQKALIWRAILTGFLWPLPLSIFDEWRQSQSAVRTGKYQDVLLDLAGMIVFLSVFYLFFHKKQKVVEE